LSDPGRKALVRLSAALASENPEALREAMERCREEAEAEAVEEVLLQSYLFLGYPVALNAFALWRGLSGQKAPQPHREDWEEWERRGAEVCETVYGGQYRDLRKNIRALHPDMERWMVMEGYGKVLGRPGLTLELRELCIASILAVRKLPRQLYSHLRGALNAGASAEDVEAAVGIGCAFLDEGDGKRAWEVWAEVRRRKGNGPATSHR
jgi:4-carboxymuconolactone decarboxylase